ncbi:MAG: ammonia-forming cytochrome c nitrite reductase subunit c552 [Chloroflexi bacterium]|nr:ammonia-forming cytochrome c nitrite reductase subunit c552 [Chloroflexota bacterium]
MRRRFAMLVFIVGIILVLGVFAATASDEPAPTSDHTGQTPPEDAEYVGQQTCFTCHSQTHRDWDDTFHATTIQDVSANPDIVVADFSTGEEFRTLEDGTVYTLEDVDYTIGSKYRQRFIMETEGGYMVLPGQWMRDTENWIEFAAAPSMVEAGCVSCHGTGYNHEDKTFSEFSITCEACHGPGSTHVEMASNLPENVDPVSDEVLAVRNSIVSTVDSNVCGQCHSVGMAPDGHPAPVGYEVGGPFDETMYVHAQPTGEMDDPFWWPNTGHNDQHFEKFPRQQWITLAGSAHGNALASIVEHDHGAEYCLPCHSTDYAFQDDTFPEDVVTMENAQFSITCVHCHSPHGEAHIEDQLTQESYQLCVSCHTGTSSGGRPIRVGGTVHHPMREMFEGISFLNLEPNPSPHFANEAYGPICSSCHMPATARNAYFGDVATHTFQLILPTEAVEGQPDSCTSCHDLTHDELTPEDLTFYVEEIQADTEDRLADLRADLEEIQSAHPEWESDAEDKSELQQMSERVHTLLSFVEADGSLGVHNPGYTDDILTEAEDLLDEMFEMEE